MLEERTISWILESGNMTEIVMHGVKPFHFRHYSQTNNPNQCDTLKAAKFLFDQYRTHKKTPTRERFQEYFPTFPFKKPKGNYCASELAEDLISKFRKEELSNTILETGTRVLELKDKNDPDSASKLKAILEDHKKRIQMIERACVNASDISIKDERDQESYLTRIKNRQSSLRAYGIPTPWHSFNEYALGYQKGNLYVIIGPTGTGKTNGMVGCIDAAFRDGKKCLIISNELTNDDLLDRILSSTAQVNYTRLQRGKLWSSEMIRLEEALVNFREKKGDLVVVSDESQMGGFSTSFIRSKVEEHQPDIIFVDGAYLMDDEEGNKDKYIKAGAIAKQLKNLARDTKLPVVITWQTNSQHKEGTDSIAFSKDLGHHATFVIRLECNSDQRLQNIMELHLAKSRNCPRFSIISDWNPSLGLYKEVDFIVPPPPSFVTALTEDETSGTLFNSENTELEHIPF